MPPVLSWLFFPPEMKEMTPTQTFASVHGAEVYSFFFNRFQ
jgi:hypothetical protein